MQYLADIYITDREAASVVTDELINWRRVPLDLLLASSQLPQPLRERLRLLPASVPLQFGAIAQVLNVRQQEALVDISDVRCLFQWAKDNRVTADSYAAFVARLNAETSNVSAYRDGSIHNEMFAVHRTFGTDEPTYFQLLAPAELARCRSQRSHTPYVLLGSYGDASAVEFAMYVSKISDAGFPMVLDISFDSLDSIRRHGLTCFAGDARRMPLMPESVEHIYTNQLFFFLGCETTGVSTSHSSTLEMVRMVFSEAFSALKRGGSLVLAERTYGRYMLASRASPFRRDISRVMLGIMKTEIEAVAEETGFSKISEEVRRLVYPFRTLAGGTTVSSRGVPYYPGVVARLPLQEGFGMRFLKPICHS